MYANDDCKFSQVPIGVVVPAVVDHIVAAHRVCADFGAPIVNRGGGTSLSGETVNYAVIIGNSKYLTRIGDIDAGRRLVTAEPAVINEQLSQVTGRRYRPARDQRPCTAVGALPSPGHRRHRPRAAGADPDGTQIEDAATGRRALHLAEVMQLARDNAADDPPDGPLERRAAGRPKPSVRRRLARLAALAMTIGAARVSAQPSSKRADTCQSCVTCNALHTRRKH